MEPFAQAEGLSLMEQQMDWWVGAIALVVLAFGTTELLHAFDIIGDPLASILAFGTYLWRLLPW
jgi:hypothetical protein